MNSTPFLYVAFKGLNDSMSGTLDGTKIESIKETINHYAIASAVASTATGLLPGVASVIAALTQAGFVWATYIKINNTLGISMSEHTAKFLMPKSMPMVSPSACDCSGSNSIATLSHQFNPSKVIHGSLYFTPTGIRSCSASLNQFKRCLLRRLLVAIASSLTCVAVIRILSVS